MRTILKINKNRKKKQIRVNSLKIIYTILKVSYITFVGA